MTSLPTICGEVKIHTTMEQVIRPQKGKTKYDAHAWVVHTATGEIIDFPQKQLEFARKLVKGGDWIYIPFSADLQNCIKRHYGNKFKKNNKIMLDMNKRGWDIANRDGSWRSKGKIEMEHIYTALVANAFKGDDDRMCLQSSFAYKKLMDIKHPEVKAKVVIGVLASKCPEGDYFVPFGAEDDDEMMERINKRGNEFFAKKEKAIKRKAKRKQKNSKKMEKKLSGTTRSKRCCLR